MHIALLIPFLFACLLIIPTGKYKETINRLVAALPIGLFIFFLLQHPSEDVIYSMAWTELVPLRLDLKLDGLAWLFSLLITGIGSLIFIYAGAYMKGHRYSSRLMAFLLLFMGAMLGLVLSDNLLGLFLFWELTSISSFFLIGFNNENLASRKSALQALAITGGGGLLMLPGLIGLGEIAETYQIHEMIARSEMIVSHPLATLIIIFILIGAFTKSAQFPFHFWLPGAMKAPTPVSAYLHSATMVKAGVYLLARFHPVLGSAEIWQPALLIFGGITMLYAAFQAIFRRDMKAILAYSTVSALGLLVFLIGLGTNESLLAAALFILIHALYKASLFMTTGIVDHETGSRDVSQLSGLRKVMMPVAIAGLLAAWSNAGIPPSLGFIGKDLMYESALHAPQWSYFLLSALVLTKILLIIAGFIAGWRPFRGSLPEKLSHVHLPEWAMWTPPLVLAVLGILFGLFPALIEESLVRPVFVALSGETHMPGHLALWHGVNPVLYLSGLTIAVGVLLFFAIKSGERTERILAPFRKISPENLSNQFADGFQFFARAWTQNFQNGYLRAYVLTILVFLISVLGFKILTDTSFVIDKSKFTEITFYEAVTVFILLLSVMLTVFSRSRLAAVASMGVMGYTICIIFMFYSAPDLAMTQFTIDTLTVILFVLVLYKLPKFIPLRFNIHHTRDVLVSLGFGALMTILTLEVLHRTPNTKISDFYVDNAYVLARGKNVVNVILVDFRGMDTIVEISVLAIAAIGVFSLLKLRIGKKERIE